MWPRRVDKVQIQQRTKSGHMVVTGSHMVDAWRMADACTHRRAHGAHMRDTRQTKGKEDTWQTRFGGTTKADTRRDGARRTWPTHGGHMADKIWRPHKADSKRTPGGTQGRLKADIWGTQGGHMADKPRASGQSISWPAFFPEKEPHSKLFGEKNQTNATFKRNQPPLAKVYLPRIAHPLPKG